MTPCARGCCWTAFQVCSRQRACRCHRDERATGGRSAGVGGHSDPTAAQAIANVMRERKRK